MKFILSILLLLIVGITNGQEVELFSQLNSDLISDDLLSISIDKDGDKWIGTSKSGLIRYNNSKFGILNKENSEIKGDCITSIYTDSKGNIWISYSKPNNGIAKYNGEEWTTYTDLPISEVSVTAICEDKEGKLYFGGGEGVLVFNDETWTKLKLPEGIFIVRAMDINTTGELAIGHNSGLLIMKNNEWQKLTEENSELKLATVRGIKFTNKDELIVGYGGGFGDGGFSIIKGEDWVHYNKSNSKVPDHMIRDIEIDAKGIIWMATNNGVIKMENDRITPILFRKGMFKNVIMDIAIENDYVWIATNFGLIKMK